MATLVLSTVGTLVAGPIGGAVGALVGQQIDNRVFAPKGRQGPRLGDLAVQTSSYGSAIPKIFGIMRVAGTVIWATDLVESRTKQGGGKGRPSGTSYSYSASFAVALSGRRIAGVRRIWADGKLLRGAAGDFKTETKFRWHPGDEAQVADPAIAAAEGLANAPAFRGIAYAVFEDFQLGEYGNRIPSLTFEVVGDEGGTATGAIAGELSDGGIVADAGAALTGFAAHGDSVRGVLAVLNEAAPAPLYDDGEALRLGVPGGAVAMIAGGTGGERRRVAAARVPEAVSIGYYDPARDYQAGLQRASHRGGGDGAGTERRIDQVALPAAMEAGVAKAMAAAKLDYHWRGRERREAVLPWREIGVRPGRLVRLEADGPRGRTWLVTGWTLERMAVRLELVAHGGGGAASLPAVAGRAAAARDLRHGPTTIRLFDAPALGTMAEAGPRLLVAAAGVEAGWRGAVLELSTDGGASWSAAGATAPAAVMGRVRGVLGEAGATLFDERHAVEVELLNDEMWLESRDDDALVGQANLAMIGDELVQFGRAEPIGPRRFRLSRLLRGRRGSEWAAGGHADGEPFTLIEAESLVSIALPTEKIGGAARIMARGIADGDSPPVATHAIGVEAVRPPSPVHLGATQEADGSVAIAWTRRSRTGWAWVDGVDAAIDEAREAYRVTIAAGARVRTVEVGEPAYVYSAVAQAEDGAGAMLDIRVEQLGSTAASRAARIEFEI